ncbi:SEC-C domain-containing protein [candidate division KSB1 bacterium]|nr:SEC-C domain-containing protein [candidate division KSB1 bacterium]MBL7092845.1 SEC-C domain-containing protein [candidate division KSB1 bacterium]
MDLEDYLKDKKDLNPEEFQYMLELAQSSGRSAFVTFVDDPNTPEAQAIKEYIDSHHLLPKNYKETPVEVIEEKGKKLLDRSTTIAEKKEIIMLLAHLGVYESYKYVKAYKENPDPELEIWANMAFDECKTFSQKWFSQQEPMMFNFFSKIGRNDKCLCGSGKKFKKCCGSKL